MQARRVMVTGGAGFVGTALVQRLCQRGAAVLVVDDLSQSTEPAPQAHVTFSSADVRSTQFVQACRSFGPDTVIHLAAQSQVRDSVARPYHDASVNVLGTVRALEAATQAGARTFVFASSGGTVYGQADHCPTPETAPLRPISPYAASKVTGELFVELHRQNSAMRAVTLRFANLFGRRADARVQPGIVPQCLRAWVCDAPVQLRGDGEQTRDFVWLEDAIDAIIVAIDNDQVEGTFNIGAGKRISMRQLVERIGALGGHSLRIDHAPEAMAEVRDSCLDATKAWRSFAWQPRVSLHDGLLLLMEDALQAASNDDRAQRASHNNNAFSRLSLRTAHSRLVTPAQP